MISVHGNIVQLILLWLTIVSLLVVGWHTLLYRYLCYNICLTILNYVWLNLCHLNVGRRINITCQLGSVISCSWRRLFCFESKSLFWFCFIHRNNILSISNNRLSHQFWVIKFLVGQILGLTWNLRSLFGLFYRFNNLRSFGFMLRKLRASFIYFLPLGNGWIVFQLCVHF